MLNFIMASEEDIECESIATTEHSEDEGVDGVEATQAPLVLAEVLRENFIELVQVLPSGAP